jgi:glycosyltransferase involved in cell wall biosynthesis
MVTVIVPAYNEEETIGSLISNTIFVMDTTQMPYELIVIDDGSTDNTKRIASSYKATVLSNSRNRGKGYAMRVGFEAAKGDLIVTIDADGSHVPQEIPRFLRLLMNGKDIVAGSRFLGHNGKFTPRLNKLGNLLFNSIIMTLTRRRVTDSQTGFRAFKRGFLRCVRLESSGYEIETEITVKGLKNGFKFTEIPIECTRREHDSSKIRVLSDGARIFRTILTANFSKIAHSA